MTKSTAELWVDYQIKLEAACTSLAAVQWDSLTPLDLIDACSTVGQIGRVVKAARDTWLQAEGDIPERVLAIMDTRPRLARQVSS